MRLSVLVPSLCLFLSLSSDALAVDRPLQDHLDIDQLQNISEKDLKREDISKFTSKSDPFSDDHRVLAVKEAAMVVGSQHGYISRLNKLKKLFNDIEDSLDAKWDFAILMRLANGNQNGRFLIPPVLQEINDMKSLSDGARTIRISKKVHKIVRPERLSLMPINWRSYLLYDDPVDATLPPSDLFPDEENPIERKVWQEAISEGWVRGAEHAEKEMAYRIRRMSSDFIGMARYIRMTMTGKMTETVVSYSSQDVVGSGRKLIEGEEVYRIAVPAQFNGDPSDWKPMILSARDSLTFPLEEGAYVSPMEKSK